MNLPVLYQPIGVADDDSTRRFLLQAIEVWSKSRKPGLTNIDEFWNICQADGAPSSRSSLT
ncbi:hypothetical protein CAF53_02575 [Sphingobium sp. LB126]|uniref:hypothetical protein n=1 Tax=Sphingobium sp. LB126 TaxID=1983755 RepID=UPI000C20366A|nr:hypothetical protein [Sphingobium sp. LB126]PJG47246.1 hypothetical protein CAF53_02575 [Sphingobium sp. LB126]